MLVVTNSYSPYWEARVDGKPQPVLPVDHAFQGVYLPAGTHVVELAYRAPGRF